MTDAPERMYIAPSKNGGWMEAHAGEWPSPGNPKDTAYIRFDAAKAQLSAAQAQVAALTKALEDIAYMGFDMPATLELTEEAWSRRRAGIMQATAKEALKTEPTP